MSQSIPPQASRLPVTDPDYRYPVSRNPYWKKITGLEKRVLTDNDTEQHLGKWKSLLPGKELHVEIGCNAGHVVLEWAAQNPQNAYIGVDWKIKAVHRAAEKGLKRELKNLLFLRAHAARLRYIFNPGEIDALYLFFPDPWPKKAQWKHRFLTEETLRMIHPLMKKGGVFHVKTDHRDYFDWMREAIAKVGDLWEPSELSLDLHQGHPDPSSLKIPDVTLFEQLFIKDGIPINSVKLKALEPARVSK